MQYFSYGKNLNDTSKETRRRMTYCCLHCILIICNTQIPPIYGKLVLTFVNVDMLPCCLVLLQIFQKVGVVSKQLLNNIQFYSEWLKSQKKNTFILMIKKHNYMYKLLALKKKIYVPVHLELFPSKHGNCWVRHWIYRINSKDFSCCYNTHLSLLAVSMCRSSWRCFNFHLRFLFLVVLSPNTFFTTTYNTISVRLTEVLTLV